MLPYGGRKKDFDGLTDEFSWAVIKKMAEFLIDPRYQTAEINNENRIRDGVKGYHMALSMGLHTGRDLVLSASVLTQFD